jgi:polyferredoxin
MRLRRYFQFGMSFGINSAFKGFFSDPPAVYQGAGKGFCVPVLNCYACPSALFSCPIGTLQHFMVVHQIPYYVMGFLGLIGTTVGRMPCGTLCPFGFFQDLLYKLSSVKIRIPSVLRNFRYFVLVALVFVFPWILNENSFSKLCPMGTLIGGLPWITVSTEVRGMIRDLFWIKVAMLIFFTASSVVGKRPFCQVACPLGALYGLFNRFSLLRLRWDASKCTHCRKCQEICPMEIEVWKDENTGHCIRCLDCTDCEAITMCTVLPGERPLKVKEAQGTAEIALEQ